MRNIALRLAGVVVLALSAPWPPPWAPRRRRRRRRPTGRRPSRPSRSAKPTSGSPSICVTTDVIVRNDQDQFIADLTKDDFEIFEDGVKQDITALTLVHGGRVHNLPAPPPAAAQEGIILPPSRPRNDAAGRIFLIIVDDLHLDFRNTGRIRDLFKRISKTLVHEGDMFSIVSTGPRRSRSIRPTTARSWTRRSRRSPATA